MIARRSITRIGFDIEYRARIYARVISSISPRAITTAITIVIIEREVCGKRKESERARESERKREREDSRLIFSLLSSEIGYAGSPPREILARGRSIDSVDRPFHPSDWVDVNLEVPSPPRANSTVNANPCPVAAAALASSSCKSPLFVVIIVAMYRVSRSFTGRNERTRGDTY